MVGGRAQRDPPQPFKGRKCSFLEKEPENFCPLAHASHCFFF
jgi:hypothetical protein